MIFTSPIPDVVVPAVSITDYVLARASEHPDRIAFVDGPTGRTMSYAELDDAVRRLAGGLRAEGFETGDVVALMAPNCAQFAVVFHGVALAGGVVTTVNSAYTASEVHKQLRDSGARTIFTVTALLDTVLAAAEGTDVSRVVLIDPSAAERPDGRAETLADRLGEPLSEQVPVDPESTVVLPYSSGTTGLNKGVMLSHRNLVANVAQCLASFPLGDGETLMGVLPFFHIYAMQLIMNVGLRGGATVVTMPRFDLKEFLRLHEDYRINRDFLAPPIVLALARHPMVDEYDLSSLTWVNSAAAPLSAEMAREAGTRLGLDIVQGYGMTELSPASHFTSPGDFKAGSVGVTMASTKTRIVDIESGADLDVDQDGEVWVRGPQVMMGYLNNDQATHDTLDADGWLHTGDIGHIDADGHLWIVDRLKELIKYKGFQVAPAELEALLLTHPDVVDAAVVGQDDVEAGEIPVAFVVVRPEADVTADDLMAYVKDRVAYYKQVRRVVFVETIPKSSSGKILRRLLKAGA